MWLRCTPESRKREKAMIQMLNKEKDSFDWGCAPCCSLQLDATVEPTGDSVPALHSRHPPSA